MTTIRRDSGRIEDVPAGWVQYYRPLAVREIRAALLRSVARPGDVPYLRMPGQKWATRVALVTEPAEAPPPQGGRLRAIFLRLLGAKREHHG